MWDCKGDETKTHLSPVRALTSGCSIPGWGGGWEKNYLEPLLHRETAARGNTGATSERWEDRKGSSQMTYQRNKCKKGKGGTEHHSHDACRNSEPTRGARCVAPGHCRQPAAALARPCRGVRPQHRHAQPWAASSGRNTAPAPLACPVPLPCLVPVTRGRRWAALPPLPQRNPLLRSPLRRKTKTPAKPLAANTAS